VAAPLHLPAPGSGIGYRVRNSAGDTHPPAFPAALRLRSVSLSSTLAASVAVSSPTGTRTSMLEAPYPELDDLLRAIGEAGRRVADIEASEGAAGTSRCACDGPSNRASRFPRGRRTATAPGCPGTRRRVPARHGFRAAPARESSTIPRRTSPASSSTREAGRGGCARPTTAGSNA